MCVTLFCYQWSMCVQSNSCQNGPNTVQPVPPPPPHQLLCQTDVATVNCVWIREQDQRWERKRLRFTFVYILCLFLLQFYQISKMLVSQFCNEKKCIGKFMSGFSNTRDLILMRAIREWMHVLEWLMASNGLKCHSYNFSVPCIPSCNHPPITQLSLLLQNFGISDFRALVLCLKLPPEIIDLALATWVSLQEWNRKPHILPIILSPFHWWPA